MVTRQGVTQGLHRVLDPGSQWNQPNTRIWFSLNARVSANQNETDVYHLVVVPQASSVQEDPNQVFLLFDDFNAASLDTNRWRTGSAGGGGGSNHAELLNGELVLRATASGANKRTQWVRSASDWTLKAIAIDTALRATGHANTQDCTQEYLSAFWDSFQNPATGAAWLQKQQQLAFANDNDTLNLRYQTSNGSLGNMTRQRYSTRWIGTNIQLWRDGALLDTKQTQDTLFTTPDRTAVRAGFEAIGVGGSCTNVESSIFVDWVIVRKMSLADPTIELETAREFLRAP